MVKASSTIRQAIYRGESVSSLDCRMTDADRRRLTTEVKAGRVYRRKGLRAGLRPFGNVSYWISADRAADLDAECAAAAASLCQAASMDEATRGNWKTARLLQEMA